MSNTSSSITQNIPDTYQEKYLMERDMEETDCPGGRVVSITGDVWRQVRQTAVRTGVVISFGGGQLDDHLSLDFYDFFLF